MDRYRYLRRSGPLTPVSDLGRVCGRCGNPGGELAPAVGESAVFGNVAGVVHVNSQDCHTGDRAYDGKTLLLLTYGVDDNQWPRADHLEVVRVTCSRRGHQLGRAYRLNQTWLFLARYDSGGAWRRRTDGQRLRTIEIDRRDPPPRRRVRADPSR